MKEFAGRGGAFWTFCANVRFTELDFALWGIGCLNGFTVCWPEPAVWSPAVRSLDATARGEDVWARLSSKGV